MSDPRFPLSVIVITRNEERNIVECLQSVAWADDIVVVDAESSDRTAELARQFTHKVTVTPWRGFSEAKGLALQGTSNEWVLWIDADERVPPGLQSEIRETLRDGAPSFAGFSMGRRAYFLGKWIRHCGWYPGYVLRLFRRDAGAFTGSRVHERLDLQPLRERPEVLERVARADQRQSVLVRDRGDELAHEHRGTAEREKGKQTGHREAGLKVGFHGLEYTGSLSPLTRTNRAARGQRRARVRQLSPRKICAKRRSRRRRWRPGR